MYVKSHETLWVFFKTYVYDTQVYGSLLGLKYLPSLSTIRSLGKLKRTKKYNDV